MNVTDQWMLERMQQIAATMASNVPQVGQNSEASKPEKGDSFKDLMDKAKDQRTEAPKKAETPKKTAQKTDAPKDEFRKAEMVTNPDGTTTAKVELTAAQAAMIAAGYSQLLVREDGTVMVATALNENGQPILPAIYLEQHGKSTFTKEWSFIQNGDQWVIEPSEELEATLEELLQQMHDPRSVSDIMDALTAKFQAVQGQAKTQVVISEPQTEQAGEEELADLSGELMADKALFKDVKATPVKVGENFQLDTQEPDMDDQMADAIRFAAQQGLRQIEIKLSPENLGSLTIKLTQSVDGSLQVVLHAANAKAANLLTQHLDNLNAALQGYNQNSEVQVQVQRNEDSQQAQQQQQQADPDGHNRQQQQQQQHQQDNGHSEDFIQRLRLGLFGLEDVI